MNLRNVAYGHFVLTLFFFLGPLQVYAQEQLEKCNKVLEGDLFNKKLSNTSDQNEFRTFAWQMFLSMNENDALETYNRLSASSKGQGIGGGVSFAGIGVSGSSSYSRSNSDEEFRQDYRKMKSLNQKASLSDSSSKTSHVSTQSILTRDPESIHAWEKCVTQDPMPGLYAYGSRDGAGHPFIKVVWAPGHFAGTVENVDIEFVLPEGVSIKNPKKVEEISVGGGKAFAVQTKTDDQTIDIFINASVPKKFNDTYEAIIPPKQMPQLKFPDPGSSPLPLLLPQSCLIG